jgi:F-type H+-transporting ATPase subunit delta
MAVAHLTYARALFDAAKERGQLSTVREEIADFAGNVRDVPQLRALIENPDLDRRVKIDALREILGASDELVRNFVLLLVEKNRATQLDDVVVEFERLVAREEGRLTVELTTAHELSADEAQQILDQIGTASGRQVDATTRVDPSLIGGIVLQAGSLRVDASVRGRLERLRHQLATTRS